MQIINVTPHPITFVSPETGEPFTVEPCGVVISATPVEEPVTWLLDSERACRCAHAAYGREWTAANCPEGQGSVCEACGSPLPFVRLVRTRFEPSAEAETKLAALETTVPCECTEGIMENERGVLECVNCRATADSPRLIVGSIIAAQAFPGRVLAMIPAPGFERVPTEQKRMRADRFTTFA